MDASNWLQVKGSALLIDIEWDDKLYQYDPERIDVETAIVIKGHTGMGLKSWAIAIDDIDPLAIRGLLWAMKHQAGERCEIATLNFDIVKYYQAFIAGTSKAIEAMVEAEKAKKPDPPKAGSAKRNGTTRKPTRISAESATSDSFT